MLILVMNSGSSSIKYKLFEVAHRRVMASGLGEKIGESNSILTHVYTTAAGEEKKHLEESRITDHYEGRRTPDIHKERPDWQLFDDGCPGGESPAESQDLLRR